MDILHNDDDFEDYTQNYEDIYNITLRHENKKSKKKKLSNDDTVQIYIPTYKEYNMLNANNYNVTQLKKMAKHYKQKISGNKNELMSRLYNYLKSSYYSTIIQKSYRRHLVYKYMHYHGPGFCNRTLCNNITDFYTMENLDDIPYTQFYSYKDTDNFIYGFDIISLYKLIKSGQKTINPYNRNVIPETIIQDIRILLRLSKILKIPVEIEIKNEVTTTTQNKSFETRVMELFHTIDSLGFYTDKNWFLSLNINKLLKWIFEIKDIWNYRANLLLETKQEIYPFYGGDLFRNIRTLYSNTSNIEDVRGTSLEIMERLVYSGINNDSKSLGAFYVLGALTLVNSNTACSIPWLYQAFLTI